MDFLTKAPKTLTLYGAALALAALIIAVMMAGSFATGPAQAQNADNTYDGPQPCGPGTDTEDPFQPEPHEITTGHFALFDSYWEWRGQNSKGENVGVMHTNLCPPKVSVEQDRSGGIVNTRTESNIDIGEAIFHVLDDYQATVVDSSKRGHDPAAVTGRTIDLKDYPEVGKAASVGDKVWWLGLNDPNTAVNEGSALTLGFSTALFDGEYWYRPGTDEDGNPNKPMRYMFETERFPGSETEAIPHFFTYGAPTSDAAPKIIWDSTAVHTQPMEMEAGEYRPVQWVFTQPGTYELSVHLLGFVRDEKDKPAGKGEDWKAISPNETETGEVKKYVFQVRDLEEMEPPLFGIHSTIPENSNVGTSIGSPIRVFESEAKTLHYWLTGEGSGDFKTIPSTNPHSVQVAVARKELLDYETKPSYDLTLNVSDRVDHENNPDPATDDTFAVRVALTNVTEIVFVKLIPSDPTPAADEQVVIRAVMGDVFQNYPGTPTVKWRERDSGSAQWTDHVFTEPTWTFTAQHGAGVSKEYSLELSIDNAEYQTTSSLGYGPITITWGESPTN